MNFAFIKRLRRATRPRSSKPSRSDRPWHLIFGARGERSAARFLRRRGHRILIRNYTCAVGEIDLVTLCGDTIVFVEVKTRASDDCSEPMGAAGPVKWRRVERAAKHYLRQHDAEGQPARFDLVAVLWARRGKPQIEHIEDAYHAAY